MAVFPGFPGSGFDFGYPQVGAALAGLIVRDRNGIPRSGIMPSREDLLRPGSGWNISAGAFVVVRADGRKVLIGGNDEDSQIAVAPAPSANSRVDLIYARAQNPGAGDPDGALFVVTGVAGAAPQKPALPAGGIEVGTFRVSAAATSVAAGIVDNTFRTTVCAGGAIPFRNTADRNAFAAAEGQLGLLDGVLLRYAGAWSAAAPVTAQGVVSKRTVTAGGVTNVPVTFPAGRFAQAPNVQVTAWGDARDCTVAVDSITAIGCVIRLGSVSLQARSIGAQWRAEL